MEKILRSALHGKGSFATRLKRAAKSIDTKLAAAIDVDLALESRDAFAEGFESSVRARACKGSKKERTWILGLDDRCSISLSHGPNEGWGKRSFLKGQVRCPWAESLLDTRLPTLVYRRIWIVFLALALQSCDPPSVRWAVSVDELAQAYLGHLDVVRYQEDQ